MRRTLEVCVMCGAIDPMNEGGAPEQAPKKKKKLSAPDYPPAPSDEQLMPVLRDGTGFCDRAADPPDKPEMND